MSSGYADRKGPGVSLNLEHVSPVTRLLEKEQEMIIMQEELDKQKEDFQRNEEIFKRREDSLRKKDLELQEALVLFNKFLKENEHKRKRQELRADHEVAKRNKWEQEIEQKQRYLEQQIRERDKLVKRVKKNEKYLEFVKDVYEVCMKENKGHFEHESAIIKRHNTLHDAHQEMLAKQESAIQRNVQLTMQWQNFKKEQYNRALILRNDSADLSDQLAKKTKIAAENEKKVKRKQMLDAQRKRETTQLIMAVDNLYQRCKNCNRFNHPLATKLSQKEREAMKPFEMQKVETLNKLNVIRMYIEDFQKIVNLVKNLEKEAEKRKISISDLKKEAEKRNARENASESNETRNARGHASEFFSFHRKQPKREIKLATTKAPARQRDRKRQTRRRYKQNDSRMNESNASVRTTASGSETSVNYSKSSMRL